MIKKLMLTFIYIISICSTSNAKEIVGIYKDSLGYNHCYVYIKFDDSIDYIEELELNKIMLIAPQILIL